MIQTSENTPDEPEKPKRRFYCVICGRHTLCQAREDHWICEECGARVEEH